MTLDDKFAGMSQAGRAAAQRSMRRKSAAARSESWPDLRAENEDDDGYDPYSDYMDSVAQVEFEEPPEGIWS